MVHHITPADNSSKHVLNGPAFFSANAGSTNDSLIVDRNAYLISDNGNGANLIGLWTVTINGTIGSINDDVVVINPDLAPGKSHVTIGKTGDVFAANLRAAIIFNSGGSITNKGTVSGRNSIIASSDDNFSVNNSGVIVGALSHTGAGNFTVTNSGSLYPRSGSIFKFGTGELKVINSGLIESDFNFGLGTVNGVLTLVNSGTILGDSINQKSYLNDNGTETHVTNTGTFVGDVLFSLSTDFFTNFKKVGKVIKSGTVTGVIDFGPGDDHFNGGGKHETVRDADGSDVISLGGGNDTFIAIKSIIANNTDADVVDGGKGIDTYDASAATAQVIVNLGSATFGDDPDNPILGLTAKGVNLSTDHITGFENAVGGEGNDVLAGSTGANALIGNAGLDILAGLGGADTLTGGADADTFRFLAISDSRPTAPDVITDFQQGQDLIDVAAIVGAVAATFHFLEFEQFDQSKGAFRQSFSHGNTILTGNLTGDNKADFTVILKGHILLSDSDFQYF